MKKVLVFILGIIIAIAAINLGVYVADKITGPKVVYTDTQVAEFKATYLEGCTGVSNNGSLNNYCSCTYDYVVDNYGTTKFIDLSIQYAQDNKLPKELVDAADACMDKI